MEHDMRTIMATLEFVHQGNSFSKLSRAEHVKSVIWMYRNDRWSARKWIHIWNTELHYRVRSRDTAVQHNKQLVLRCMYIPAILCKGKGAVSDEWLPVIAHVIPSENDQSVFWFVSSISKCNRVMMRSTASAELCNKTVCLADCLNGRHRR